MLYVHEGQVYSVDPDGTAHGVDVTAKDRVVEVRELESVTFSALAESAELPEEAVPATEAEVVAKFNVSEKHPLKFKRSKKS